MIPKPSRIVLDTNVCLDLFVFRDPRWQRLLAGLETGLLQAVTRTDCRKEWLLVLQYSHLPLDEAGRHAAQADFDRLIQPSGQEPAPEPHPLPACKDKDDQKFLELARDAGAEILITKDKALLKLARRLARIGLFRIITPEAWLAENETPNVTSPAATMPA
ncbi:PIN domain-containing protein [Noviherbaspirillum humi]|nr:PIN domain-containing protein [Noviherbaspirillum humi]